MASAANLNVAVTARTDRLERQLNRSKRQWRSYSRQISRQLQTLTRRAAASTAILTAAFGAATRESLRFADDIAKTARTAGVSAKDYQLLVAAFSQLGINTNQVTKVLINVSKLVREAGRGTKTYTDILDQLNLSYETFNGLSSYESFLLVVESLRNLENQSLKTALSSLTLGRAANQMGTLLDQGSEGIRAVADRVQTLGGVINQGALDSAEKINDTFDTFGRVLRAQFINGLSDAIGKTQDFDSAIRSVGRLTYNFTSGFVSMAKSVASFRDEIVGLITVWISFRAIVLTTSVITGIYTLARAFIGLGQAVFFVVRNLLALAGLSSVLSSVKTGIGAVILGGAAATLTLDNVLGDGSLTKSLTEQAGSFLGGILEAVVDAMGTIGEGVTGGLSSYFESLSAGGGGANAETLSPGIAIPEFELPQSVVSDTSTQTAAQFADGLRDSLSTAISRFEFDSISSIFADGLKGAFEQALGSRINDFLKNTIGGLLESVFGFILGTGGVPGRALSSGAPVTSGPDLTLFSDFTFHDGGIVGGVTGQDVPAVLQAGELVLTRSQQSTLFDLANGAGRQSQSEINYTVNITGNVDEATNRYIQENRREVAQIVHSEFTLQGLSSV